MLSTLLGGKDDCETASKVVACIINVKKTLNTII